MTNLIVFACSHGKFGKAHNGEFWQDDKSWPFLLAERLNVNLINYSRPGASNFHIFNLIYEKLKNKNITDKDIVLVHWSYVNRIWQVEKETIMPHVTSRQAKLYYKFMYNDIQEINKVIGYSLLLSRKINNFYFDFTDGREFLEKQSPETFNVLESERGYLNANSKQVNALERHQLFDCNHMKEEGHMITAEKFYQSLKKNLTCSL